MLRFVYTGLSICLLLISLDNAAAAEKQAWQPLRDEVFLQEVGYKIPSNTPLTAIALLDNTLYVGSDTGVSMLQGMESLTPLKGNDAPTCAVQRITAIQDALYVMTVEGVYRFQQNQWTLLTHLPALDAVEFAGDILLGMENTLYKVTQDWIKEIAPLPKKAGALRAVETHAASLFLYTEDGLWCFDGKKFTEDQLIEFGELPSNEVRDIHHLGSSLFFATDKGLGLLRGTAASAIQGKDGLCYEDTVTLATGFGGDLWIGTSNGAMRYTNGKFHYFHGPRWLPGNAINTIACSEHTAYIATDKGLAIIDYEPYTLQKKAAYYERHLTEWGQRRGMFIHKLWQHGKEWLREISDNDGGYSTHYWTGQAYKYAATGDKTARERAVKAYKTMRCMEELTPIDGFIARSLWLKGEKGIKAQHGSGNYPAEWVDATDPRWETKMDTSSDEVNAHFHYSAVFYNLVANEEEKEMVRTHMHRLAGHILDHGYQLVDLDGKPTRWARWDPEYAKKGEGFLSRGVNSLEALAYMRTAWTITGEERFQKAYEELQDWGYLENITTTRHKGRLQPTEFDDLLMFFVNYCLFSFETDPALRSLYQRCLERFWETERIEHNPWYNFLYGLLTGNDCEIAASMEHLRAWPLDLYAYTYTGKHRSDLFEEPGYISYGKGKKVLSPRERGGMKWEYDPYRLAYGEHCIEDPSGFICSYWLGRYAGFILPPDTDDPALLTVPERGLQLGAEPYTGPEVPCELTQP